MHYNKRSSPTSEGRRHDLRAGPRQGLRAQSQRDNGFSCFVERTEQERADFRNDVYAAICFDAEGSEKILPVWMDTAKMRAEGRLSPLEVKQEIAETKPGWRLSSRMV